MPRPGAAFGRWFSLGLLVAKGGRSEGEPAGETYLTLCCSGDVVASMAPSPRRSSRKDANALPSASSTFWAVMILVGLLIAYCSQLAAVYTIDQRAKSISKWTNGTVNRVIWVQQHGDHTPRIQLIKGCSVTDRQKSLWNTAQNAGTALRKKYTQAHNGTWRENDRSSTKKQNFD